MSVLFVQQISIHHSRSDVDEKSLRAALKADYGYDGRRLSRFTLNALAAALPIGSVHHSPESGVYLGARFSSPAKFDNMLATLAEGGTPKPFDFTGNIHNAACFHTAQALGLYGPSLFMPVSGAPKSWSQPLLTAWLDLQQGTVAAALAGWCSEQSNLPPQQEGCCWLLLSIQQQPGSIARIRIRPSESGDVFSDGLYHDDAYQTACRLAERLHAKQRTLLAAALGLAIEIEAV